MRNDGMTELTAREREVVELVVAGLKTEEIAGRLGVSAGTVSAARWRVGQKWGVATIGGLVRRWYQDRGVRT